MSRNRPHEYIVYTHRPSFTERDLGYRCKVVTRRIPHGKFYRDYLDYLPASVGRLAVVSAYSAASAKEYAATHRGVRCDRGLSGAHRRRRKG
jgi:hypothetical protein